MDAVPLAQVIGERVRFLRSHAGVPQEAIAVEARRLGLGWAKSSVAAIEAGKRALSIEELILLPLILGRAKVMAPEYHDWAYTNPDGTKEYLESGRHPVGVPDLLPDDDRLVLLADGAQVKARVLRTLFAPTGWHQAVQARATVEDETEETLLNSFPRAWLLRIIDVVRARHRAAQPPREWDDDREPFFRQVGLDSADDATRKAAAALGVPALAVALVARALWFAWGLTGEREHRVFGSLALVLGARFTEEATAALTRDWQLTPEQKEALWRWHMEGRQERALPPVLRRKLQAMRGHFTRELLDELRPHLADLMKRKATKRRTRR